MWRTGLRVSEVLELEWRDLDYSGDPATLLVRKSKSRRARTVRLHQDLVQLFTRSLGGHRMESLSKKIRIRKRFTHPRISRLHA